MLHIDINTNKQQDAQYWLTDFLQLTPVADNYHHTNEVLSMCKQFVTEALPAPQFQAF